MEKIMSFFAAVSLFFGYLFGTALPSAEGAVVTGVDKAVGINALYAGQGITADEDYYYTSGSVFVQKTGFGLQFLAKWTADGFKPVKKNSSPLPKEYVKNYGCGHIGGISCYDGIIYAPVEGTDYSVNFVFLYDADSLDMIKAYNVSNEYLDDGIPWIAVDGENGFAYCSRWGETDKLLRFNLEDMSLDGTVPLSTPISRIQGGDFYDGVLYLSRDDSGSTVEAVYAVDVQSGEVTTAFVPHLVSPDNEAEDIAVIPRSDGSVFHSINYDKLLGVNVVHFAPELKAS